MAKKRNVDLVCDIAELMSLAEEGQDRKELLQGVVSSVGKHMQADVCSIYIYDEDHKQLTLRATKGLDESAIGQVTLGLGEGITGRAVRELLEDEPRRLEMAAQARRRAEERFDNVRIVAELERWLSALLTARVHPK